MNKKGKYLTSVSIGVATVWFSTHCGAGFASGTQELQYFANHGWFGVFLPILTFTIIAITQYIGLESAREVDRWDYAAWSKAIYGSKSKVLTPLMDVSVILATTAATAATLATGGKLANQYLGIPAIVGTLVMLVIVGLLSIFGAQLVRKNAMIMTSAILVIISIVIIAGLIKFAPDIARLFGEGYVNPEAVKWGVVGSSGSTPGNLGNSILWALTYAGFQISAIGGISAAFRGGASKEEAKGAMILGAVLNIIMLVGICLLIFSQMPFIFTNQEARVLPTVYIVKQLNIGILDVLYPVLLFLALITTGVGFVFGLVTRLDPYILNNMENKLAKKALISVVILFVCFLVSTLGLMWIVGTAYRYLGIYNWIFIIIPLWAFGFKFLKNRKSA